MGNNNYSVPSSGMYYFKISTPDEGQSWNIFIEEASPGLIGNALPSDWAGPDTDMAYDGDNAGTLSWSLQSFDFLEGEMKIRFNDSWEVTVNYENISSITGTSASIITDPGNTNYGVSTAGTYSVVLSTSDNGSTWTLQFD